MYLAISIIKYVVGVLICCAVTVNGSEFRKFVKKSDKMCFTNGDYHNYNQEIVCKQPRIYPDVWWAMCSVYPT